MNGEIAIIVMTQATTKHKVLNSEISWKIYGTDKIGIAVINIEITNREVKDTLCSCPQSLHETICQSIGPKADLNTCVYLNSLLHFKHLCMLFSIY